MNEWTTGPEDFAPTAEPLPLLEHHPYPNVGERAIRIVLHVMGIVALALVSLLMFTLIRIGAQIGDAVDRVNTPDVIPTATGCPFGDGECGG